MPGYKTLVAEHHGLRPSVTAQGFTRSASTRRPVPGLGLLPLLPLAIRIVLMPISGGREYDQINLELLVRDPSVIAFVFSTFVVFIVLLRRPHAILEIFRRPLVFFVTYAAVGTTFSLFTPSRALGVFIGYEFFIYYLIAGICVNGIVHGGDEALTSFEKPLYAFCVMLMIVALVDILLPSTHPFEISAGGNRRRFIGALVPLQAIQWSAISAVSVLMAAARLFRGDRSKLINGLILVVAGMVFFLSGTRGAFGGVLLALLLFLFFVRRRLTPGVWITIVFAALVLGSVLALVDVQRLESGVVRDLRLGNLENTVTLGGRTKLWSEKMKILLSNPFQGYGIGLRYRPIGISSSMHNFLLEVWVGAGLIGVVLFLGGMATVGKKLLYAAIDRKKQFVSRYGEQNYHVVATACTIATYLVVHSLVESNLAGTNNFFSVPFLYCTVIAQALYRLDQSGASIQPDV